MNPSEHNETEGCLVCKRNSDDVPLLQIRHKGETYWICPEHFPVLIHNPIQLIDKLPGVIHLGAAEGH